MSRDETNTGRLFDFVHAIFQYQRTINHPRVLTIAKDMVVLGANSMQVDGVLIHDFTFSDPTQKTAIREVPYLGAYLIAAERLYDKLSAEEKETVRDTIQSNYEFINKVAIQPVKTKQLPFNDIESVEWAHESILKLLDRGVINGMGNGTFQPNANVTREQFIKMLVHAFDFLDEDATTNFSDVKKSEWYYSSVASAHKVGLTKGYPDGNFGVGKQITREEMAVLAYRAAMLAEFTLTEAPETIAFVDEQEIAEFALEAIYIIKNAGIIQGMGDNRFAPKNHATRAQSAKIIYTLLEAGNSN